jgi:hypothetical protein
MVRFPGLSKPNAIPTPSLVDEVVWALPYSVEIVNSKAPTLAMPATMGRAREELRRERPTPEKAVHAAIG